LLASYRSDVTALAHSNLKYPKGAIDQGRQGEVVLRLKLNRQGDIVELSEELSSPHHVLNKAAIAAVNTAAPFPEVPAGLLGNGDEIEISLPFTFEL